MIPTPDFSPATIARPDKQVLCQHIDDEAILLNLQNGHYYTLNPVGAEMWKLLDGTRSIQDIAGILCRIYAAHQDQIEHDMLNLLRECHVEKLVCLGG